jgi:hypothetical protein
MLSYVLAHLPHNFFEIYVFMWVPVSGVRNFRMIDIIFR